MTTDHDTERSIGYGPFVWYARRRFMESASRHGWWLVTTFRFYGLGLGSFFIGVTIRGRSQFVVYTNSGYIHRYEGLRHED